MKVPTKIGQNCSFPNDRKRNIAPVKEMSEATLSTVSVGYLPKRYTARKSDGGESRANDIAHILIVTVEDRS